MRSSRVFSVRACARLGRRGLTLVETVSAIAVLGVLIIGFTQFLPQLQVVVSQTKARQRVSSEARRCAGMIRALLVNAQSGSIVISTPPSPAPACSRIQFVTSNETEYDISWSTQPPNSVHVRSKVPGSSTTRDDIVGRDIASLMFFFNDFRDPTLVRFTVQARDPAGWSDPRRKNVTAMVTNQLVQTLSR